MELSPVSRGVVHRNQPPRASALGVISQTLTLAAALTSTWTGARISGVNFVDYLLVASAVLVIFNSAKNNQRLPIYAWALIPPVSLVLIALLGSIVRGDSLSSNRASWDRVVGNAIGAEYTGAVPLILRMTLALTVVATIVAGSCSERTDRYAYLEKVIVAWAAGAAISALYGVVQYLGDLEPLPFLYRIVSDTRATGLANHPNSFGQTISLALPALIFAATRTRGSSKIAMWFVIAVSMYAVVLSGSRGALLCGGVLAFATLVFLARSSKGAKWVPPIVAFSIAAAVLILPAFITSTRFFDDSGNLSNSVRMTNLEEGLDLFFEDPVFGAGVGSWNSEFVPLILLTSGGILYLITFYCALAYPLFKSPRASNIGQFASILCIIAVGFFAFGLVNNGIVERYLYWPFAALFALKLYSAYERPGFKVVATRESG